MVWRHSIKLVVAQDIFSQFDVKPHKDDSGTVVCYSAMVKDEEIVDRSLTVLCKRLVESLHSNVAVE